VRERLVLRRGLAAPLAFFAVERFAAGLRAVLARLAPVADDLARLGLAFSAPLLLREAVERLAVERFAVDLRALPLRLPLDERDDEAPLALELSSAVHLPDMTRWAASATASAISEPSFVALATMLLAACEAVSAASSPASRIARRALGLALIAAAAAASPAASISLLIAALAILSTVSLPLFEDELEELLFEEPLRAGLAIASTPYSSAKRQLKGRNGSRMNWRGAFSGHVKGHRRAMQRCPSTWSAAEGVAVRQRVRRCEHPSPTSLLNHETSDHLLSLR
jgi:hypothetical protein